MEGCFRGCSGLFRGDFGRFLVEKWKEITGKNQDNYTGKNQENPKNPIK